MILVKLYFNLIYFDTHDAIIYLWYIYRGNFAKSLTLFYYQKEKNIEF